MLLLVNIAMNARREPETKIVCPTMESQLTMLQSNSIIKSQPLRPYNYQFRTPSHIHTDIDNI